MMNSRLSLAALAVFLCFGCVASPAVMPNKTCNRGDAGDLCSVADSLIAPKHWLAEKKRRIENRKAQSVSDIAVPATRPIIPDRIYWNTRQEFWDAGLLLAQEFEYFVNQFDEGLHIKKWNSEIRIAVPLVDKRAANVIRAIASKEVAKLNRIVPIRLDDENPNVRIHVFGRKSEFSEPLYCAVGRPCALMTSDDIINRYRMRFSDKIYVSPRQDPRFRRRTNSPYEGTFAFFRDATFFMGESSEEVEAYNENVEGYIASNSAGEIFQAECYIYGHANIDEIRQHTLECLVRILGFPGASKQLTGTLLAKNSDLKGSEKFTSIGETELALVRALYETDVRAGPEGSILRSDVGRK